MSHKCREHFILNNAHFAWRISWYVIYSGFPSEKDFSLFQLFRSLEYTFSALIRYTKHDSACFKERFFTRPRGTRFSRHVCTNESILNLFFQLSLFVLRTNVQMAIWLISDTRRACGFPNVCRERHAICDNIDCIKIFGTRIVISRDAFRLSAIYTRSRTNLQTLRSRWWDTEIAQGRYLLLIENRNNDILIQEFLLVV